MPKEKENMTALGYEKGCRQDGTKGSSRKEKARNQDNCLRTFCDPFWGS